MSKSDNQKIWQSSSTQINKLVESYTVGEDYLIDLELLPYDIAASKAHATMLHSIGILNEQELEAGISSLSEILCLWEQGNFAISPGQEDVHTAIEAYLTLKCKSFGFKIHTGRSRNDQVLVMLRLYMKDKYEVLLKLVDTLISTLDKAAVQYSTQQMPGYTHTQKAMPAFVGLWFESFKDGLTDIKNLLVGLEKLINQNPLGSASGFGISNFNNNRALTTKLLKFAKTQENPLYCGYSRGYFESIFLQTFSPIIFLSSKFANDFILFSTQEFDFF
jgi:argininosuccinate lyase